MPAKTSKDNYRNKALLAVIIFATIFSCVIFYKNSDAQSIRIREADIVLADQPFIQRVASSTPSKSFCPELITKYKKHMCYSGYLNGKVEVLRATLNQKVNPILPPCPQNIDTHSFVPPHCSDPNKRKELVESIGRQFYSTISNSLREYENAQSAVKNMVTNEMAQLNRCMCHDLLGKEQFNIQLFYNRAHNAGIGGNVSSSSRNVATFLSQVLFESRWSGGLRGYINAASKALEQSVSPPPCEF